MDGFISRKKLRARGLPTVAALLTLITCTSFMLVQQLDAGGTLSLAELSEIAKWNDSTCGQQERRTVSFDHAPTREPSFRELLERACVERNHPCAEFQPRTCRSIISSDSAAGKLLSAGNSLRVNFEGEGCSGRVNKALGTASKFLSLGSAVFKPSDFVTGLVTNGLRGRVHAATADSLHHAANAMWGKPKTKYEAASRQQFVNSAAQSLAHATVVTSDEKEKKSLEEQSWHSPVTSRVSGLFSIPYLNVGKVVTTLTSKMLEGLGIDAESIGQNDIAEKVIGLFEDQLPETLKARNENGQIRAVELYKKGSEIYNFAEGAFSKVQYVYSLVDCTTAVVALLHNIGRSEKIPIFDLLNIAQRCARGWLRTIDHFGMYDKEKSGGAFKLITYACWSIVQVANFILPKMLIDPKGKVTQGAGIPPQLLQQMKQMLASGMPPMGGAMPPMSRMMPPMKRLKSA